MGFELIRDFRAARCAGLVMALFAAGSVSPVLAAGESEFAVGTGNSILMSGEGECWQAAGGKAGNLPECGWTPPDSDGDGKIDEIDHCPDTPEGVHVNESGCPSDWDHDGVPNFQDACPKTPKGAKINSVGCALDSDGDGVKDYADKCPGTPSGMIVDAQGCPSDDDGDGVANKDDKCPNTVAGAEVDADGCAKVGQTLSVHQIEFDFDKAVIKDQYKAGLDQDVAIMNANPAMSIMISGHTDNVGTDAYNQKLSERRAVAVKDYMASKGVDETRMTTEGKGEVAPVARNNTAEGRAQNRRVELTVTSK